MTRDPITHAAARFRGWLYGGLDVARSRVDCCSMLGLVVAEAYGLAYEPDARSDWWRDVCVYDGSRPWSMLDALHHSPGGWLQRPRHGPDRPEPGRWHAVQGWQSLTGYGGGVAPGDRGHQLLYLASVDDPWRGWTIESQEGVGPCMRTAHGYEPLAAVLHADGRPVDSLPPVAWGDRMRRYGPGLLGWVVLPETA